MKSATGRYESVPAGSAEVLAFVPDPLPPRNPKITRPGQLSERLRVAEQALARLNLASDMVPSRDWLVQAFLRKEVVLSAQLDGLQADLMELLNFEAAEAAAPHSEAVHLHNHLKALNHARERLALESGLPILPLLHEAQRTLIQDAEDADWHEGAVRQIQTWIGDSRPDRAAYIPPPASKLPALLDNLEGYLQTDDELPLLVRMGLAHVQFASLHPYLAGSGRIGRLLITLLLEDWGLLNAPLLYLSLFFKRHHTDYERRLAAVRDAGDWEGWTDFFLEGVAVTAEEATATARALVTVITNDRLRLLAREGSSLSALRLFEQLPRHPVLTVAQAMTRLQASKPTAIRAVETLVDAGILVETTGRKRDRSFAYKAFIDELAHGTTIERN